VLVAEDGSDIVGVLRARPGRLQSLFVRRDRHRRGIGRALVDRFERQIRVRESATVKVAATIEGVPFYLAMGYKRTTGIRPCWSFWGGTGLYYQPMKKAL